MKIKVLPFETVVIDAFSECPTYSKVSKLKSSAMPTDFSGFFQLNFMPLAFEPS